MGKHYSHLTVTERELLAKLYYEGNGPSDIAQALGRDKGTVSRELSRNASSLTRCYTPCRAQLRNDERRPGSLGGVWGRTEVSFLDSIN